MRTYTSLIIFIAVSFLLSGIVPAQSQQKTGQIHTSIHKLDKEQTRAATRDDTEKGFMKDYRLGPGDSVKISVYNQNKLSGTYKIDGSGNIDLPLIGVLKAKGRSVDGLRKHITDKLKQGYLVNPSVTVGITRFRPFYMMGEINQPGGYEYVDGITVLNAVAISGGFTYRADRDDIIIIRKQGGDRRRLEVSPDARVMPGDTIQVQERFF